MQYANSHVGLCLWRTKVGQVYRSMKGRDYFGEVMDERGRHGLHRVAYYSLIFDYWAFLTQPGWRIIPEGERNPQRARVGTVCINSHYRAHALSCLTETSTELQLRVHLSRHDVLAGNLLLRPLCCPILAGTSRRTASYR